MSRPRRGVLYPMTTAAIAAAARHYRRTYPTAPGPLAIPASPKEERA